jgi:hypothetical protein
MGFGENLLKIGRVISKEWRPYCWMNENYDLSKPCKSLKMGIIPIEAKDAWCCEHCPFKPKKE